MNLCPLRRLQSKFSAAFVVAAALVLSSCGGGGATSSPIATGALQILPATATLYAGVPYTLNIAGGRGGFLVTSSEPTLIALNYTTSSSQFSFVPNNPGVVDVGLDPNEVPRRTVLITVRDSLGNSVTGEYNVLQNFFTGYGESYASTCATAGTGPAPQACSGTDTIVTLLPVSQGALYGNRVFQFDRVRGDFSFVQEPPGNNPQLLNTIRSTTDQTGKAMVRIRVGIGAPTQLATYKVTDIATGVTTDLVFLIIQQAPVGLITVVPGTAITFTGPNSGTCGFGSSDQYVFDGTPPYTITPPANIGVTPLVLAANGDRFTVTVGQGAPVNACPSGPVVIIDAQGRRFTLQVTSVPGTTTIPITVAPLPLPALTCTSNTSQAAVIGGVSQLQVISNHPRVFATISGNVLSVLRAANGDGATIYPATATLVVTDGATINTAAITFAVPANCP